MQLKDLNRTQQAIIKTLLLKPCYINDLAESANVKPKTIKDNLAKLGDVVEVAGELAALSDKGKEIFGDGSVKSETSGEIEGDGSGKSLPEAKEGDNTEKTAEGDTTPAGADSESETAEGEGNVATNEAKSRALENDARLTAEIDLSFMRKSDIDRAARAAFSRWFYKVKDIDIEKGIAVVESLAGQYATEFKGDLAAITRTSLTEKFKIKLRPGLAPTSSDYSVKRVNDCGIADIKVGRVLIGQTQAEKKDIELIVLRIDRKEKGTRARVSFIACPLARFKTHATRYNPQKIELKYAPNNYETPNQVYKPSGVVAVSEAQLDEVDTFYRVLDLDKLKLKNKDA